jgi:hypothetical protein
MYIVLNTLYLEDNLHVFVFKSNAVKYLKSLPSVDNYVVLDVNFKAVNDIKAYVKKLFKVEKKVVLEPVLEPTSQPVQEPVQEPAVQSNVEPVVDEVKPAAQDKSE